MAESLEYGKKVFFLYPQSVIQEEVLTEVITNEYEAYVLRDHERALKILKKYPTSIMFINIDDGLKEAEWEAYVRQIKADPDLAEVKLGILSYNTDKQLMQKYLMDLSVPCGYIHLKLGVKESTRIILEALKANEAKGRRKFIRAACAEDEGVTLNYVRNGRTLYGKVLDISSAGVAFQSSDFVDFQPNAMLRKIQFKLRGSLVMVDGILIGKRKDAEDVWTLLFDPKTESGIKVPIHKYIRQALQRFIDTLKV